MLGCIPLFARVEEEPASQSRGRPTTTRPPADDDLPDSTPGTPAELDTPREGEIEEIFGSNIGKYEQILARIKEQQQRAANLAAGGDLPTVVVGRAADAARTMPSWDRPCAQIAVLPAGDPGEGVAEPTHLPPPVTSTVAADEGEEIESEAKDLHGYLKAMQNAVRKGSAGTPQRAAAPGGKTTPQRTPASPSTSQRSIEESPSAWDAESNFRRLRGTRFKNAKPNADGNRNILSYR